MSEANSGFSFGAAPDDSESDSDDGIAEVDAIEVTGEPVSRMEAQSMGFASFSAPEREKKLAATSARMTPLPDTLDDASVGKLEMAWDHLKRNEIEEALTLAQETAWQHPTLAAAKLIVARCFISRREYDKAEKILASFPEEDCTAESMYYRGLCLSRLGNAKDAIDILKRCRDAAAEPLLQKRASDLLLNLRGEKTPCPICGKKYLYDSLVESGNQLICANCAKSGKKSPGSKTAVVTSGGEDGDEEDEDEEEEENAEENKTGPRRGGKRRKRLRPPLTRTDLLLRSVFVLFLFLLVGFIFYLMYLFAPGQYAWVYSIIPVQYNVLPVPPPYVSNATRPPVNKDNGDGSFLSFSSSPLNKALPQIPLRHFLRVAGASGQPGEYNVSISPPTAGTYSLNKATGEFLWTPAESDAGKTFEITFSAVFDDKRAHDQISSVRVGKGFEFRRLASVSGLNPTQTAHLVAADMDSDGKREIILVSGEYWNGDIVVFKSGLDDAYQEEARIRLSGRPTAVGVIPAGNERWLAVADYWHARIRFFVLREGRLSEVAVAIDLPGQPILADFDAGNAQVAVLYRTEEEMRVAVFRQAGQLNFEQRGNWPAPGRNVWRRLALVHTVGDNPALAVLAGGEYNNSLFIFEAGRDMPRAFKPDGGGVLVNATPLPDRTALRCLTEQDGELFVRSPDILDNIFGVKQDIPAGPAPALCGFTVGNFTAPGFKDILVLSTSRLGIIAGLKEGANIGPAAFWNLPEQARPFATVAVLPESADGLDEAVFLSDSGTIWAMRLKKNSGDS